MYYYVECAAQITFVPQNFFCHARDDSSLAAKCPCVQKRIDCSRKIATLSATLLRVITPWLHRDAHRIGNPTSFVSSVFKPRRRFVKVKKMNRYPLNAAIRE